MEKKYDVFGVGNALVDILAFVDDPFLGKQRVAKGSMTLVDAEEQGDLFNELEGVDLQLRSGGSAANSMIAVAQSGGTAFYTGKVAKDSHGEFYRQDLAEAGVDFDVNPSRNEGPTGTSLILTTPDAERTMCTNLGVSVELEADDIELEPLAASKFLYVEGYLWDGEQPRAASRHAMESAKSQGVPVAFTFSDMFLVERFGDDFRQLAKEMCDVVFANADEIRHFFGLQSLDECATQLGQLVPTGFITDGPNGCYVIHEGEAKHVPGFAAQAIDTVGAGDAFAGGVLFGLTHAFSLTDAARWGNYAASQVVQIHGARLEESVADQVDKVLGR